MKNLFALLCFTGLLITLLVSCESSRRSEKADEQAPEPDGAALDIPAYTGRLYSSGLSRAEAESLQLEWPVYQLSGAKSYFLPGHDSLRAYLGRCIGLEGAEVKWESGTENYRGHYTYLRGGLSARGIQIMEGENCLASASKEKIPDAEMEFIFYRGTVRRMERPAPDIVYDYALQLEEPFRDEFNQVEPGRLIDSLPLFFFDPNDVEKMEKAIASGEKVMIEAALIQGYAESKVLQVRGVQL